MKKGLPAAGKRGHPSRRLSPFRLPDTKAFRSAGKFGVWGTPVHARWLGHLPHAHASGMSLSAYAARQDVSLAALMGWEHELRDAGVPVPERHRPARFINLEVVA